MTYFPEAIGWTLSHFIWQATAIAVVYKWIDRHLGPDRANLRYSLALAALLCMLGTSVATLVYEHLRLNHATFVDASYSLASLSTSAGDASRFQTLSSFIRSDAAHLFRWVDCTWLIGVLFFAVRALGGVLRLRRLRSALSFEPVGEIAARFSMMIDRMGLKCRVSLRIHSAATNPFMAGAFRSIVYLPISALTALTPDQIDAILAHELAHVHRADYAWNLLQTAMETLFFFHPAVWWLGRIVREERELCCDDLVLESCSSPLTYAKALLVLAENQQVQSHFAMPLDGHRRRHQLFSRIARILGEVRAPEGESYRSTIFRLFIPAVAGTVVLFCSVAIPLCARIPVVRAVYATHINASLGAPFDARGILPGRLNSRFRSAPSNAPQTKAEATASRQATPSGESTVQLVAFNVRPATKATSDSLQALTQQPLFHMGAYETHGRHQRTQKRQLYAQERRQRAQELRRQARELRRQARELRRQARELRRQARELRRRNSLAT